MTSVEHPDHTDRLDPAVDTGQEPPRTQVWLDPLRSTTDWWLAPAVALLPAGTFLLDVLTSPAEVTVTVIADSDPLDEGDDLTPRGPGTYQRPRHKAVVAGTGAKVYHHIAFLDLGELCWHAATQA